MINAGISLCTFDFSGCGNAEGEYISLGYHEIEDLKKVIDNLKYNSKISGFAIWGRSMGAATSLLYLEKYDLVSAAVFDSSFTSVENLVRDMLWQESHVPGIIATGALKILGTSIKDRAGFDVFKVNPLKKANKIQNIPGFFIVGADDEIIPCEHTKKLYEEYGCSEKELKTVNGKHNDIRPAEVVDAAIRFILKHVDEKPQGIDIKEMVSESNYNKMENEIINSENDQEMKNFESGLNKNIKDESVELPNDSQPEGIKDKFSLFGKLGTLFSVFQPMIANSPTIKDSRILNAISYFTPETSKMARKKRQEVLEYDEKDKEIAENGKEYEEQINANQNYWAFG